jgi:hypothetical protein|tara:strand:- start:291 stop:476 length:186 start_codon:yes stop_codon:yes gene_type:complete
MSKTYNNIQDVSTDNLYKMLNMDRYQDKDSQTMIKAELSFRSLNMSFNDMTNVFKNGGINQ